MGRPRSTNLAPVDVDRLLSIDIKQMQTALRYLQEDLVAFRDPDRLRSRLAEYELEPSDPFDDLEDLAVLMRDRQPAPRGRRRRR